MPLLGRVANLRFNWNFANKKTGVAEHQLYVDASYLGDWYFYQSGAASGAILALRADQPAREKLLVQL